MLANYHTHTYRCKHARGEDREYVEAAIRSGIKVLGFSDHCPWIYEDGYESGVRMTADKLDDYFDSLSKLKKEYVSEITIYAGFEAEYIPELMDAQIELLKDYPVDFMILGEHFISREPSGYMGYPTEDEAVLKQYVDLIIEGMETGKYLYVTHPDLMNYVGPYEIYEHHMLRLCRFLKDKNVPVEINMLGVMQGRHYPSELFLGVAQRVGNSAIIGVDAHNPNMLELIDVQKKCRALAEKYGLPLIDYLPGL